MNTTEEQSREHFVSFDHAMPLTPTSSNANFSQNKINPDEPHWNFLSGLGIFALSIVLMGIFGVLTIVGYTRWSGAAFNAESLMHDPSAIVANLVSIFPAHLLTILAAWLLVTRGGKQPFFETIGWRWNKKLGFWSCAAITFGLFVASALIISAFGDQENELTKILQSSRTAVYLTALMATLTAPITEEIVYRGVLYPALRKSFGITPAVFAVTTIFASVHFAQYYPSYGTILAICVLSLTLTIVRAWTVSLLPCFVIHTLFNGVQSVLLIVEPFLEKSLAPTEHPSGFFYRLITG